jgi:antitoxin (DNA-binding transcriptional repressor) of toxin-antitoxin stability system
MVRTISATELARNLSEILSKVKYQGESFIVERGGDPVARIEPVGPTGGVTLQELVERLEGLWPDKGFFEELEALHNSQERIGEPRWRD